MTAQVSKYGAGPPERVPNGRAVYVPVILIVAH